MSVLLSECQGVVQGLTDLERKVYLVLNSVPLSSKGAVSLP